MLFFVGWHQPVNGASGCTHFERSMISINRLLERKSDFPVNDWILDSGAFTRITAVFEQAHYKKRVAERSLISVLAFLSVAGLVSICCSSGKAHLSTRKYAKLIRRWSVCGNLLAAVAQDYICEPFILNITGLTVEEHQKATIARYDNLLKLLDCSGVYLMPVLQGYVPEDYVRHISMYGERLNLGMWVGVGSLCKRNRFPVHIEAILLAIKAERPDLKLHGFGLKKTALGSGIVCDLLHSADSQAHGVAAMYNGKSQNDPAIATQYLEEIEQQPIQRSIFGLLLH